MGKILAKDIKSAEIIKFILESQKPLNEYIDTLEEGSFEYENLCEKVEAHYLEIDEALVGEEKICNETLYKADMRRMIYWKYIKTEITWNKFVKEIRKYSDKLLINIA